MTQEHGGDLDAAIARFGGAGGDWIDLSTGINRVPYPAPEPPAAALRALPTRAQADALIAAARIAYGTRAPILPLAGAQAAIQLVPRLRPAGRARVLGPTYAEHARQLQAQGWRVAEVTRAEDLAGADLAVVVNPNNPDGRQHAPEALAALAGRVGLLVVDESFADTLPGLSLAPRAPVANLLILRSFGKFYGLAGLRLGFAIGPQGLIDRLAAAAGPWAVAGPALAAGTVALADAGWAEATRARLGREAARLDALAAGAGWQHEGGTALFRLYRVADAAAAQAALAQARIWSRIFDGRPGLIRLGLPGPEAEWDRLAAALG
jgi:cobalamin biosynthetic protein CobC